MIARSRNRLRLRWKAALARALGLLALVAGCASPEERHQILTFFFDGVPPLVLAEDLPGPRPLEEKAVILAQESVVRPQWSRHDPYDERACDECHVERSSNRLVAERDELCFTCHDAEDFGGRVVHGPVAAGECTGCHDPHKARNPNLLVRLGSELCSGCHDPDTFVNGEEHRVEQGEDCVECHNPHASEQPYMLRRAPGA